MIPRRISQIWLGGHMPVHVELMVQTVWNRHPDWELRLWTEDQMPALGVRSDRLRDEFGTWAAASNFVRLLILQKFGGFYLDTDFVCHKPLDGLIANAAVAAMQDGGRICNAFMGAEANHPWVNWQLANIAKYDRRDAASGVYLATDAPRDGLTLVPPHLVYPWMYGDPPEKRVLHSESLLEHHWEGSWSQKP